MRIHLKSLKLIAVVSLVFTLLYSCKEDSKVEPQNTANADVIILNEGGFGQGNASVDLYNSTDKSLQKKLFQSNNQGRPIGDVLQSMNLKGDSGFMVVNNSQKVEVVDINSFKSIGSIKGLSSPRYILFVNSNKAYISDLISKSIQVVNTNTLTVSKSIALNGWTENMEKIGDTVYACDMTNNQLLLIDANEDTLLKETPLIQQPGSMVKDKNNNLWVLCTGGYNAVNPKLFQINRMGDILQDFEFQDINESPSNLTIDGAAENLYFLNNGLFKMNITASSLPSTAFIGQQSAFYYGLGINPKNGDIYLADAVDFQQNGFVYRYNSSAQLIQKMDVGLNPNGFEFLSR